ncbi:hypothetical protein P0Y35_11655 [Kiritimatiellaeota bacterium B1221]|nr:hypothetical protein [Kiritimatiellaeota bacterium B1221]
MANYDTSFKKLSVEGGNIRKTTSGKFTAEISYKENGKYKRTRKNFSTQEKAESYLKAQAEIREETGLQTFKFSQHQIADFQHALETLSKEGMQDVKLSEIVNYYVERKRVVLEQWTVAEAVEKRLANMQARNLRPASIVSTTKILNVFKTDYASTLVRDLTEEEVSKWIKKQNGGERRMQNVRNELSTLFNFTEENLNAFTNNICKTIKKKQAKIEDVRLAEIMTPKEVENFMRWIEENKPKYIAMFALMFWAGIRPEELTKTENFLKWEDIKFDEENELGTKGVIYVKAKTAKTRKPRKTPISANLMQWLKGVKKESGKIGFAYSSTSEVRREAVKESGLNKWVQDFPRHSYATNAGELHSMHKSAGWIGHVGGIKVFLDSYQGLTSQAQAKEYFNIMPKSFEDMLEGEGKNEVVSIDEEGVTLKTKSK